MFHILLFIVLNMNFMTHSYGFLHTRTSFKSNKLIITNIPSKITNLFVTENNIEVNTNINDDKDNKNKNILPGWLSAFTVACIGGALFGLDIGSSSSVLRILGNSGFSSIESTISQGLNPIELGQIASGSLFGAIISSTAIVLIGDKNIGRKMELQIASLLFLGGTMIQSLLSSSIPILLSGRVLYGLGIGVAMHAGSCYICI